ncbi:DUF664 domain-containing protein, partial [Micromonospora sp. NPDC006766]|uniref:mycothiol transferase n=1 Tax=Micromonospora sp. NPDC006766 TaxID=3154778 RepID=UPI0033CAA78F
RRVLMHIIAETAQHAGHADIIRESLNGAKSMDPDALTRQSTVTARSTSTRLARRAGPTAARTPTSVATTR